MRLEAGVEAAAGMAGRRGSSHERLTTEGQRTGQISRAPWKAELAGGGHQGTEEEAGVTAEPLGPWAEGGHS